jgi:predicted ATP-grasp superfamily ATP-dependent carboligase
MTRIPLSEVKTEWVNSRQTMLQQGIKPVQVFCYPNGNFDRDIQELVRESGYLAAVGCEVGLEWDRPSDLFALKRISLHEDSSALVPLLAFALSGFRLSRYQSNVKERARGAIVMEPKACVLVTDGQERSALAITRGLGQAGIPVVVGAETARSLAGASRYCVARWRYPSPLSDPSKFISSLVDAAARFDVTAIMPVTDAAMQVIAAQRNVFRPSITGAIPPMESYDLVSDKYRLMRLAQELRVPIPDTIFVEDGRLPHEIQEVGGFPLIVKPGRSLVLVDGTWTRTTVQQAANRPELEQLYRDTPYLRRPSLIQRRVEGEGQGIFALCDQGTPLALFAHRRLREKPPSGGVSVLRESIELPKVMTNYAVELLKKVRWHGVAMVEFKVDGNTGVPRLMEINGRFWGSLQLALDAGVNFPHLLYQLLKGEPVVLPDGGYRVGVRSRWLLGDLDHLLVRTFKSDETLRLPPGYPSRAQCALEFMRFFQKDLHYEIERWDDPAPARYELRMYLKTLVERRA